MLPIKRNNLSAISTQESSNSQKKITDFFKVSRQNHLKAKRSESSESELEFPLVDSSDEGDSIAQFSSRKGTSGTSDSSVNDRSDDPDYSEECTDTTHSSDEEDSHESNLSDEECNYNPESFDEGSDTPDDLFCEPVSMVTSTPNQKRKNGEYL